MYRAHIVFKVWYFIRKMSTELNNEVFVMLVDDKLAFYSTDMKTATTRMWSTAKKIKSEYDASFYNTSVESVSPTIVNVTGKCSMTLGYCTRIFSSLEIVKLPKNGNKILDTV
jgi:hypothetical protein